jgi:TolB-like protein
MRSRIVSLVVLGAFGLLAGVQAARAQTDPLQQAVAYYDEADYDRAITAFAALAQDAAADKQVRREALQYLGRAYVAKSLDAEARKAIRDLLALEPPLVELDPDAEMPTLMQIYYDERKAFDNGFSVKTETPQIQTIAVVDFTNASLDDRERFEPMTLGFPQMMTDQLLGATGLKVVERERLQWLLAELQLQRDAGLVDQATAVQAGKLLGAHVVLFGSYSVVGREIWISTRLVKVETGEILLSEQVKGRSKDFFDLVRDLSQQTANAINVTLKPSETGARTETRSMDAMLSYSQGLQLLDKGDYPAAYAKFQEAIEYDPSYTRAQRRADSLKPLLQMAAQDGGNGAPIKGE